MAAGMLLVIVPIDYTQADVSLVPLSVGGGDVPGNMVLVPSVEWPTIESVANLDASYSSGERFEGYFDSAKCYEYVYDEDNQANRHFEPSSLTDSRRCSGADEWSGNFLNWATTQTIDPFRKVLTGGLRVVDTPTETWLEKARHPGQGSGFPIRDLNDGAEVAGATPFSADRIQVRIRGLGTQMRFSLNNTGVNTDVSTFTNAESVDNSRSYNASVRVEVCNASVGVEDNCRQYRDGWKPEGLIQQNANDIRFSVFGYLNDSDDERDGGVLRAQQKYVGPVRVVPGQGEETNTNKEWNEVTGVMIANPNPDDATASGVANSGVMNYLNKFGQLNEGNNKSKDPVSELYYAATRYLKNQGNVPAYSSLAGADDATKDKWLDGFPVIESWDDPIQYECQPNVLLGIGDVNTHDDKNLPGSSYTSGDEPTKPTEVENDETVDVVERTNKVGNLEGVGNIGGTDNFSGRGNSAFIAGLAFDNRIKDLRSDLAGKQTASTHWVDVLENQNLRDIDKNQYYLAAKYGGFDVPEDYDPEDPGTLEEDWWFTNGEDLPNGEKRPDNYYLAGEASKMVEGLREAFANIGAEINSSASAFAANSTTLNSDAAVFDARFDSTNWSGDLLATAVDGSGNLAEDPIWSAASILDDLSDVAMISRNILTVEPLSTAGQDAGELLSAQGRNFLWNELTTTQQEFLRLERDESLTTEAVGRDRLDYLRGDRSQEQSAENTALPFRLRDSRLGDIVNSTPAFSHLENRGYGSLNLRDAFSTIDSYNDFRDSDAYQDRTPLVMVGANDGMFHGFNADVSSSDGGEELFAFVPASVYDNLYELTLPDYGHRYYVDGSPVVSDAWLNETDGWRTIAVSTTGAGANSVFALDVTDPESVDASSVLWEFSHPDMGKTIQQPTIVALANGEFGVVVSSGYDSDSENGKVWVLEADTGRPIATFELENSGELGSPLVIDRNNDRIVDRIYVGDTEGKLWRIDIEGALNKWGVPASLQSGNTDQPLFTALSDQPITAPLQAAFTRRGDLVVYFGTGSFFNNGDNVVPNDPAIQSFYGIIDGGEATSRSDLLDQQILTRVGADEVTVVTEKRLTDENGWFLDLVWTEALDGPGRDGERVVTRADISGTRVTFFTLIPSEDPCAGGGEGRIYSLDASSGGRLSYSVFDINGDLLFNEDDFVEILIDGELVSVPGSAFNPDKGIIGGGQRFRGGDESDGEGDGDGEGGSGGGGTSCTDFFGINASRGGEVLRLGCSNDIGRQNWEQVR
jgi:type IV pilus assembly protein PilY1